jgi:hypothetical protein
LSGWSTSFSNCTGFRSFTATSNRFTPSAVNFILCNILQVANTNNINGGTIDIRNSSNVNDTGWNAGPDSSSGGNNGIACKASLTGAPRNWVVQTACNSVENITIPTIQQNSVIINWTAQAGVTTYQIQYKTPAGTSWLPSTPATSNTNTYTLTGLAPNTSYNVRIRMSNTTPGCTTTLATAPQYTQSSVFTTLP